MVAMTQALALHWATGQSSVEDGHLAAILAWIDPPAGRTGAQCALEAEDPALWPPAGPATDPEFDNRVLAPAMERCEKTGDPQALQALRAAIASQLAPTWELMWRAVDLLGALSPGRSVSARWAADRDVFTQMAARIAEGAPPQPRRDGAVVAARRLHRWERAHAAYTVERAYDDPLVMAEYRLTGEAFVGTVVDVDRLRIDASGRRRVLRPQITVDTEDRARPEAGTTWRSPARPTQRCVVVEVAGPDETGTTRMIMELSGGMGRALTPAPGSVPEIGERLSYTCLGDGYSPPGTFPEPEDTPWTHGGPPEPPQTDHGTDAGEDWS